MFHTLAVLGAGNMGAAIIRGVLDRAILSPRELIVADPDPARLADLASPNCALTSNPIEAARSASQILLAVKPQSFPALAASIAPALVARASPAIVISIMAGRSSQSIRAALGPNTRIIRAMPNTPCRIGAGITAVSLGEGAQAGDDALALRLFSALGQVVNVEEGLFDAITALSASGPAYLFLIAESMLTAAARMNMPPDVARRLVTHTIIGAGKLLEESHDESAESLRRAVTSPGGTTAVALDIMLKRQLPDIIVDALIAARDRGRQLNQ